jgi:hypothetical protein
MRRCVVAAAAVVFLLWACGGGPDEGARAVDPGEAGSGGEVLPGGGAGGAGEPGGAGGAGGIEEPNTGGTGEPTGPAIEAVIPGSGVVGTYVELRGRQLQATRDLGVTFRGGAPAQVLAADREGTWIRTYVPPGAQDGPVYLRLGGVNYEGPTFDVSEENPAPTVERIAPDHAFVGDANATVRLEGWGFIGSSRILLDDLELVPKSRNIGAMEVVLPADVLANQGRRWLRVENPEPGGGVSEAFAFQVSGDFNVLRAEVPGGNQVRVVFDRPPVPLLALDPKHYAFDCPT